MRVNWFMNIHKVAQHVVHRGSSKVVVIFSLPSPEYYFKKFWQYTLKLIGEIPRIFGGSSRQEAQKPALKQLNRLEENYLNGAVWSFLNLSC